MCIAQAWAAAHIIMRYICVDIPWRSVLFDSIAQMDGKTKTQPDILISSAWALLFRWRRQCGSFCLALAHTAVQPPESNGPTIVRCRCRTPALVRRMKPTTIIIYRIHATHSPILNHNFCAFGPNHSLSFLRAIICRRFYFVSLVFFCLNEREKEEKLICGEQYDNIGGTALNCVAQAITVRRTRSCAYGPLHLWTQKSRRSNWWIITIIECLWDCSAEPGSDPHSIMCPRCPDPDIPWMPRRFNELCFQFYIYFISHFPSIQRFAFGSSPIFRHISA